MYLPLLYICLTTYSFPSTEYLLNLNSISTLKLIQPLLHTFSILQHLINLINISIKIKLNLFLYYSQIIYISFWIMILFEGTNDNFHSLCDCVWGRKYEGDLTECCICELSLRRMWRKSRELVWIELYGWGFVRELWSKCYLGFFIVREVIAWLILSGFRTLIHNTLMYLRKTIHHLNSLIQDTP